MLDRRPLAECAPNSNVRFESATAIRANLELAFQTVLDFVRNLPLICHGAI